MNENEAIATSTGGIDINEVMRLIPHRPPMLLIDRAEDYVPFQSIVGIKAVTINEAFFGGHFPGYPVMPGVLICEAIAQSGGVLMSKSLDFDTTGKTILLLTVDNCRFRHQVRPGDLMRMPVQVIRQRGNVFRFRGKATVDGKVAAEADFGVMVVETPDMSIHPTAMIADGAVLGEGVEIGPYCVIGPEVKLGAGTRLLSHVVVEGITEIGRECVIHPFASLGGPPQHVAYHGERTRLVVGDRNLIREYVTMNAGTPFGGGLTSVGNDGVFYASTHVAHDCTVGDHVILTNCAALGGHVRVSDYVIVGGLSAAHQHIRIGRHAFVSGMAGVDKDVIPFGMVKGNQARLMGLNLVGLKRRNFSREVIRDLRAAYRLLFADEGTFQERVEDVARAFAGSSEVMEIIEFIQADSNRPLCLPHLED